MDNYIKKHVDELYETGKTTFRDINGEYDGYLVELEWIVQMWSVGNSRAIIDVVSDCNAGIKLAASVNAFVTNEIKQLCIDYYGDE